METFVNLKKLDDVITSSANLENVGHEEFQKELEQMTGISVPKPKAIDDDPREGNKRMRPDQREKGDDDQRETGIKPTKLQHASLPILFSDIMN